MSNVSDHNSQAAPDKFLDIFFDILHSLHNGLLATSVILGCYMVQDNDHEMADPFLQFFDLLFNSQCILMRTFSSIVLQSSKVEFNEPHILE